MDCRVIEKEWRRVTYCIGGGLGFVGTVEYNAAHQSSSAVLVR